MFRHVVMMQFSPDVTEREVETLVDRLRGLPEIVPEIRSYSVGVDAGLVEGNFDLVVVGDFDSVDDYHAYSANADHQAVIAELIRPILVARSAVQYHVDTV